MADHPGTLLLARADVERLLTPQRCIDTVEAAFHQQGLGKLAPSGILGMHAEEGSFHIKAGLLNLERPYFAAKLNANFPDNGPRHGLPTIQGALILCDATDGRPLAIMDSMSITALRTAAASAIAAKFLARPACESLLICGCGGQALAQLRALLCVRRPRRVLAYDIEAAKASAFVQAIQSQADVTQVSDLAAAIGASDIVVTCTTSRRAIVTREMVRPGTFIAAIGADSEGKQEIDPQLLAQATVVTDVTEQACAMGDLHHAIEAGVMSRKDVHAELGQVVAGLRRGRASADEITIFDSTGTGLQDVAAAVAAYQGALREDAGLWFSLATDARAHG